MVMVVLLVTALVLMEESLVGRWARVAGMRRARCKVEGRRGRTGVRRQWKRCVRVVGRYVFGPRVPFGGPRGVEQKTNSTGCLRAVGHRDRYRRVAGLRRAVRTRRSTRGSCSGSSATLSDRLGNRAHFQGRDQPRAQRAVNQQNCSWWWWWLRWWRWRWWWWGA